MTSVSWFCGAVVSQLTLETLKLDDKIANRRSG